MENRYQNNRVHVSSVTLVGAQLAAPVTIRLNSPAEVVLSPDNPVSPMLLCSACVPRLPVNPLGRLLLGLVLCDSISPSRVTYTYAGLGATLGREASTVERAAMELRRTGLIVTRRLGIRGHALAFSCQPFLDWASTVIGTVPGVRIAPDAQERPSTPAAAPVPVSVPPAAYAVPEADSRASGGIPLPDGALRAEEPRTATGREIRRKALAFVDTIVDDRPDWPAVPGNWRGLVNVPLPCDDDVVAPYVPLGVKPWLCGIPRLPNGDYDLDKLVRMPYQIVMETDEAAFHALCQATGDRQDGPIEIVENEPPVDASAEREAELRLAGPRRDDSSEEEFAFDSGADTAETDIGHGVQANPDL